MKCLCPIAFATSAIFAFAPTTAEAAGWGAFARFANTSGTLTEVDLANNAPDLSLSMQSFGVGFVFDTAVARDRLLNWRLNLGFEYNLVNWSDTTSFGQAAGNISTTFGFGVYRGDQLRLFIGPGVRFVVGGAVFQPESQTEDVSNLQFDAGIGPVIGGNFHLAGTSLSLSLAYYLQITQTWVDDPNRPYDGGNTSYNYVAVTHVFALTFSALFRGSEDEPGMP